jgi:hypothetical protein
VLKNRIINGAMVIDQRNAGASITASDGSFGVDRFKTAIVGSGVFTMQQSSTAPTGFSYSQLLTVTTADTSIAASDEYSYRHFIEGYNIADLGWGTADAKTITLSFWVRSSVTGTYAVGLRNSAADRTFPATYTISVANTWELKSVTVAGDTSGTWLTTNGIGIGVIFSLGAGSNYQGTANSWNSGNVWSTSTATQWISNAAATWRVTGVQLEIGSSATPFERRLYNQELANCQRYYYRTTPGSVGGRFSLGQVISSTLSISETQFPVPMRTSPTALEQNGTAAHYATLNATASGVTCSAVPSFNQSTNIIAETVFTVASGLTAGNATVSIALNSTAYLGWSAEL